MANKIDTALSVIAAKLGTVTGIRKCERRVLNPARETVVPIAGVVASRARKVRGDWTVDVVIMAVTNRGNMAIDERAAELMEALETAVEELRDDATAGCNIGEAMWDSWFDGLPGQQLMHVGVRGELQLAIEAPLTTA